MEIQGGKELQEKLRTLPDRIAINVMRGAMYAGARVIRDIAIRKAPELAIDYSGKLLRLLSRSGEVLAKMKPPKHPHIPGLLKKSIVAQRTQSRDRNTVGAKVGVTSSAFYGHMVEFGHQKGKGRSSAPPHPFMRPAADEGAEEAIRVMAEYAGRRIEQEAAKKA
jgi:HK97 gp10 family phage protein